MKNNIVEGNHSFRAHWQVLGGSELAPLFAAPKARHRGRMSACDVFLFFPLPGKPKTADDGCW